MSYALHDSWRAFAATGWGTRDTRLDDAAGDRLRSDSGDPSPFVALVAQLRE